MKCLSLAIVGIDFPNKRGPSRRFELTLCVPGEPVELRLEPKNKKDERAVAVYSCRGVQLGYLIAERAPWIGAMIRQGREIAAVFQGVVGNAGWARVAFDGEQPALPAIIGKVAPPDDSGFWPDPIYDE